MTHKYTNALIEETSPYLLQHAHNPVNWEAWKPEVLARAQKENKPLLISIGYASCHWCHVMEHECFEDEEVAQYMNEHFVNIKIDREERPDVDQIYMDALQMMTGSGGWPLNVVTTPDGRPFWGATYLPKDNWLKSLEGIVDLYTSNPERVEEYATNLEKGIKDINLYELQENQSSFSLDSLDVTVATWSQQFDTFLGGYKRAPKFMMPNNLDFLLHYAVSENKKDIQEYVDTTLTRMAYGGIYDHIGGGFSRYSVDTKWHVPHFEKMLYDNGQLVSLYAKAYAQTKNPLYKKIVDETIAFVKEELLDENGGFYSSLDADSTNDMGELEEGAYYVWKENELDAILGSEAEPFKAYFNINSYGLWENENYVLIRDKAEEEVAKEFNTTVKQLNASISSSLKKLKAIRNERPKPRLDDKILTSWNALMLKGLTDAYKYTGNEDYLTLALTNANFLKSVMLRNNGGLYRNHKNGKSTINAFLEDYATLIEAYIGLYEVTFDENWLLTAKELTAYTFKHFLDPKTLLFFYTSDEDEGLIRRSFEINDNVISSSNSIMANNLLKLHKIFPNEGYAEYVDNMLFNVQANFSKSGQGYANWLHLILFKEKNFYEIAIVGDEYKTLGKEINASYTPNSILLGSPKEGNFDLLQNRYNPDNTLIYVCIEGACKLPVQTTEDALKQL
ncbi:thioredoxin [Croceivirga lutea]|uniref:thioredoxin domain-containing protein n=1 Tax=Croceivirga lutea TaxID=1775167 RepID=UPI00163A56C3|nr:thioredoxin domain-containing protein [Croceivirga lutea]GGG54239.1 thioredoxin [Croceivirga lutea]